MGDPKGFLKTARETPRRRPVDVRLTDWREVYEPFARERAERQAARCMDCGIPFCHSGCPLGNLIPEWNDLVYRSDWAAAADRLHATNNFPEFTGRLCPAPCESACVLGINAEPVTIKQVEVEIIDRAWAAGGVVPLPPAALSGFSVAVVGSGPAGLAAAQQLTRAGHLVTVFERDDAPGGLLRYGIPEFKMEKRHLDRRIAQMEAEGTEFRTNATVGDGVDIEVLLASYDAMEYLPPSNRVQHGDFDSSPIDVKGKRVVIIGGGDTGADCLGTAHRQGAKSVHQLEIMAEPPSDRLADNPWPLWPLILRTSSAHEEGGARLFSVTTTEFVDDGSGTVRALRGHTVEMRTEDGRPLFDEVPGSAFELECDLVLLAMGFVGTERRNAVDELGVEVGPRGTVTADPDWATNVDGVFVCGDQTRGQSLIVWAIAEGRSCAAAVDRRLMGTTSLPAPVVPGQVALR